MENLNEKLNLKNVKYWALGFNSNFDRLSFFKKEEYWQAIDYAIDDPRPAAKKARRLFKEIQVGDFILIKGYGGSHDLIVHFKAQVLSKDSENERLELQKVNGLLYKGKAPRGAGAGIWHDTILQVKREKDIELLFGENVKDMKSAFIDWMIEKSKPNYFNNDKLKWSNYLDDSLNYFKKDIFQCTATNYKEIISLIEQTMNANKPLFYKNDGAKDSGKLAAILGKENYTKFLEGYFNDEDILINQKSSYRRPLNQILFGPPGTGKTYRTISNAIAIVNPDFDLNQKRSIIKKEYNRLSQEGSIIFTTFHQSMSYEDFVEGIKPKIGKEANVQYVIEDGVFKCMIKNALSEYLQLNSSDSEDFETLYLKYIETLKPFQKSREGLFKTKTGVELMLANVNESSILVKYLWSNNKKEKEGQHTFSVTKEKLKRVLLEEVVPSEVRSLKAELHPLVGHIHCELFAVYKNFYDFVISQNGSIETVKYNPKDLIFDDVMEEITTLTKEEIKNKPVKNSVLIIDEINRGNVSGIFGELITLLEKDKRIGEEEEILVKLPYSKKEFGIPLNLHIIGTMNTADRSVESLDTALRRRFEFKEMMPNYDVIKSEEVDGIKLADILKTINERIALLIDRDHTIGHSYFFGINTKEELANAFNNKIVPLLQEYFYGDYGKIGLVLGEGFVEEQKNKELKFSSFKYEGKEDFIAPTYHLKKVTFESIIEAVKNIFNTDNN
ncbi:McrB family protein [Cellulophaga baltica]|uniref:AAA domain (Dynein-related subfamily) n=1 Tax=Cellulophaga baltica TaxID=76594 RepID=A0A1G7HF93_9FLAO|nr:AAA family ATPase [Cellulophaga baltica]SDE99085.1 AAA domain (dynein-related subfamily) [Cellulophaga baltica]